MIQTFLTNPRNCIHARRSQNDLFSTTRRTSLKIELIKTPNCIKTVLSKI